MVTRVWSNISKCQSASESVGQSISQSVRSLWSASLSSDAANDVRGACSRRMGGTSEDRGRMNSLPLWECPSLLARAPNDTDLLACSVQGSKPCKLYPSHPNLNVSIVDGVVIEFVDVFGASVDLRVLSLDPDPTFRHLSVYNFPPW